MAREIGLVALTLVAFFAAEGAAKVWERCTLASELLNKYQLPRTQLNSWMCIAWRESRYDSLHINTVNTDGSKDYGLFQINNRWWCTNSESPQPNQNMCNVHCDRVLNDLDETVKCIKIMYAKSANTWQPWITYPYCEKEDMTKFTKGCDLEHTQGGNHTEHDVPHRHPKNRVKTCRHKKGHAKRGHHAKGHH